MLVRIALVTALLAASPALAADPSNRAGAATRCAMTHQLAPHGKGIVTPIVKCEAKTSATARNDAAPSAPTQTAPTARN
jgi:hypothetical protein